MAKRYGLIVLFSWGSLFISTTFGQSLNNVLFTNSNISDKVLRLNIAPQYEGTYFIVGLVVNNEVVAQSSQMARAGSFSYDLGEHGLQQVNFVATNLPKEAILNKELAIPQFSDWKNILLAKEGFTPRIINFVTNKKFYGINFSVIAATLALLVSLLFLLVAKFSLLKAVLLGALVGTVVVDLVYMQTHWDIYQQTEKSYPYLPVIKPVQQFVEQVTPLLEGQQWSFQGKIKDEFHKIYMIHHLAEIEFIAPGRKIKPPNTYFITQDRPTVLQEIIYEANGFYLVR